MPQAEEGQAFQAENEPKLRFFRYEFGGSGNEPSFDANAEPTLLYYFEHPAAA